MATLRLALKDYHFSLEIAGSESGWTLGWNVKLPPLERVQLPGGNDLSRMPGSLRLSTGGKEADGKTIGLLKYLPAFGGSDDGFLPPRPASYEVSVIVTEQRLRELLEMVQRLQGPTGAYVSVPGLAYGWAPDGSEMKWDLKDEQQWLRVEEVTFSFAREAEAEPVSGIGEAPSGPSPEVQAIAELTRRLQRVGPWIVGLLALIAAGIFLR